MRSQAARALARPNDDRWVRRLSPSPLLPARGEQPGPRRTPLATGGIRAPGLGGPRRPCQPRRGRVRSLAAVQTTTLPCSRCNSARRKLARRASTAPPSQGIATHKPRPGSVSQARQRPSSACDGGGRNVPAVLQRVRDQQVGLHLLRESEATKRPRVLGRLSPLVHARSVHGSLLAAAQPCLLWPALTTWLVPVPRSGCLRCPPPRRLQTTTSAWLLRSIRCTTWLPR